ncbi:MAG: 5-formyltetrahydrofolate cyclo-ligase, partial [Gammaproteobacteria bacterium]
MLARRRTLPFTWRHAADAAIGQRLLAWLGQREPSALALWWPLPGEPDLTPLFAPLTAQGWTIALPRAVAADQPLEFGLWSPAVALVEHRHRVLVPEPFAAVTPALLVAPCLGFDPRGWRLGYGGGYYDRTLAALGIPAAGVAYDACET